MFCIWWNTWKIEFSKNGKTNCAKTPKWIEQKAVLKWIQCCLDTWIDYIIFWSVLSILIQMVLKILHYGRFWCSYSILLIHFATFNVVFWSRLSILTQSHPLKRSQTIFCCFTWQQVHSLMRICNLSLEWNDAIKPRKCLHFASSINEITFC